MTAKKKSIPVAGAVGNPPTLEQTLPVKTALPVSEQKILPKSVSTATEELEKAPPQFQQWHCAEGGRKADLTSGQNVPKRGD